MLNYKITHFNMGLILLLSTLACASVGTYNPQATQVAMEGTVTSLQATITAMEETLNKNPADESPIVVTATPTSTPPQPIVSVTVIPVSSLGQTIQLTPTPTFIPMPSPSPNPSNSQDRIITLVATLTATPSPEQHTEAPIIIEPVAGSVVEEGREILLHWGWNGWLKESEYFDIKIKLEGQDRSSYVAWEQGQSHLLGANLTPGRYYWSVQVLKGYYKNNSGEPEDRVFETFTSPESEPRLIIVGKKAQRSTPTPAPTRADAGG